jgi:tight adherence protein C
MKDLATLILNPTNLITSIVALLAFFSFITLAQGMTSGDALEKRMKSVANRRDELRRLSRQNIAKDNGVRQKDGSFYQRIVDKFNLKTLLEDPKVVDNLAMAGFRGQKPVTTFYFFRLIMPFVLGITAALYLYVINTHLVEKNQMRILISVAAFVLGYYAPNIYISNKATKRKESIVMAFPDSLDLLLICVESGMSIEAALQRVSEEIGSASIELAEELSLMTAELSYLPERRMAYEGLARRTNHEGIKSVCTAMIQAEKYGTPLGQALRVMSKENRELRLSAAEKKAAALPAQLTVPMIVFFLPVLFVVILGPAGINIMDIQKKDRDKAAANGHPVAKGKEGLPGTASAK